MRRRVVRLPRTHPTHIWTSSEMMIWNSSQKPAKMCCWHLLCHFLMRNSQTSRVQLSLVKYVWKLLGDTSSYEHRSLVMEKAWLSNKAKHFESKRRFLHNLLLVFIVMLVPPPPPTKSLKSYIKKLRSIDETPLVVQNTPNSFTFYVLVWKGHNLSWVAKHSSVSTWCNAMMATTYPLFWVCIVHN